MKNGVLAFLLYHVVEWHTEMTRKSEAVIERSGIVRFAADELHAINAYVQNSMRDTSYKVEVLSSFCVILERLL